MRATCLGYRTRARPGCRRGWIEPVFVLIANTLRLTLVAYAKNVMRDFEIAAINRDSGGGLAIRIDYRGIGAVG